MDINDKIQAASHSGASLSILREGDQYFVLKEISDAVEKNLKGIQKQIAFKSMITGAYEILQIPVTDLEVTQDSLRMTMPFIEGVGGEEIILKGSKAIAKNLKVALNFYLVNTVSLSNDGVVSRQVVLDKISEIEKKMSNLNAHFPKIHEQIEIAKKFCTKDLLLPIGDCHGDLTLSNLKVEDNKLYIFDFLSCDINSPLQDAAKLIQDFEYGWSFRKEKDSLKTKSEIFCKEAYPSFLDTLDRLFKYEMRIIEVLTILRIGPYINLNDQVTVDWFNSTIEKSISKVKNI